MKKRILTWLILSAMAVSLCSCEEKDSSSSKTDSSSVPDTTTTTTTTTTAKQPDTEPERELFDIDGYGMLDETVSIDNSGDATLVAKGILNSKFRDKYVDVFTIENIVDGSIIASCTLSDDEVVLGDQFGDGDGDESYLSSKRYIFKIDISSGAILNELLLTSYDEYATFLDGGFTVEKSDGDNTVTDVYDYNFKKLYTSDREGGFGTFKVNRNADTAYYIEDKVAYALDLETKETKAISDYSDFSANYVDDVMTIGGKDYVSLTVLETDGETYDCIVDVTSSETYRFHTPMGYLDTSDNIFQLSVYDDSYNTDYILMSNKKDELKKVELPDGMTQSISYMLDDSRLFYSFRTEDGLFVEVHDLDTNKLVGSLSVTTDLFNPDEDKMAEVFGDDYSDDMFFDPTPYYLYGKPLFTDENTVMLRFSNNLRDEFYVLWEIGLEDGYTPLVSVSDDEILPHYVREDEIEERFQFIEPTEITGEFVSLREKADALEEKYGVEFEIASEAAGVIVGFAMMPTDSYKYTSEALEIMDRELGRYPEGFLTQIRNMDADLIRFYLTADVVGFTDEFEYGGVCTTHNDEIVIALEVGDLPYFESSLHHELSHAIDVYVEEKLNNPEFADGWDALNPQDDIWYSEGEAQLHELYIESFYTNIDTAGAYYVDEYGHTNATEDRARIFETVMSTGNYTVRFDEAPFLMAKLNYYAESIRKAFDGSENWGEVPWEAYMN